VTTTRPGIIVTLNIARLTSGLSDLRCDQGKTEQPSNLPGADSSKGTVFDVTGNKAYGPEGSYKGERGSNTSVAIADLSASQYSPAKTLPARSPSRR